MYTLACARMSGAKAPRAARVVTMRDFRAAPSKYLRRAAREGTPLRLGELLLTVRAVDDAARPGPLHGAMRDTGRVLAGPATLLSADDAWSTDD